MENEPRREAPGAAPQSPDFRTVYRSELGYVWATLRRLGAPASDLEDLTHEVFMAAFRKWSDYDARRPIRPWLFGFVYRILLDHRRKGQTAREVIEAPPDRVDPAAAPDDSLVAREEQALFAAALDTLDPERRAVFVMHDVDGHRGPEIAAAIGIPLNTVYSRLRLAREQLAQVVKRLRLKRGEA